MRRFVVILMLFSFCLQSAWAAFDLCDEKVVAVTAHAAAGDNSGDVGKLAAKACACCICCVSCHPASAAPLPWPQPAPPSGAAGLAVSAGSDCLIPSLAPARPERPKWLPA